MTEEKRYKNILMYPSVHEKLKEIAWEEKLTIGEVIEKMVKDWKK